MKPAAVLVLAFVAVPLPAEGQPEAARPGELALSAYTSDTLAKTRPGEVVELPFHVRSVGEEPVRARFDIAPRTDGWTATAPSPVVIEDETPVDVVLRLRSPSDRFYENRIGAFTVVVTPEPIFAGVDPGAATSVSFLVTNKGFSVPGAPVVAAAALALGAWLRGRSREND